MTREEFIRICGLFGLGLFQGPLTACGSDDEPILNFSGKVLIIGAGAGGLSAGYFLNQHNIEFEILEASTRFGGRMRINTDFADFPINLGSEWLETDTGIFERIVNDPSVTVSIETHPDPPDKKFINSSWFGFFEEYIHPSVQSRIRYETIVESVDYSGSQVVVHTEDEDLTADVVILAVPLKVLQDGDIGFTPSLPQTKLDAIAESHVWGGFKAFIEFSEKFYDDEHVFSITPNTDGEKIYYDTTLGQNTPKNILGLFAVGKPADQLAAMTDTELRNHMLTELDELYNDQATAGYIRHISQNWNQEPFIKGGYLTDHADWRTVRQLGEPVGNKIFFAGGAFTDGEDWVSVHTAAESARRTVDRILFS